MTSAVPLTAVINNYAASTTVTISVNGHSVASSYFQITNGTLTGSIPIINGMNTIVIYAVSPCGSDSETISILRCKNPSVNWINPALVNTVVTSESFTLQALANNAFDESNIQFTFNGSPVPFSFNSNTEMLSATVNLTPGNNVFAIRIQNTCGATNCKYFCDLQSNHRGSSNPGNNNNGNNGNINNGKSPQNIKGNSTPNKTTKPKGGQSVKGSSSKQTPKNGQPKANSSSGNKVNSKKVKEGPTPPKTPIKKQCKRKKADRPFFIGFTTLSH